MTKAFSSALTLLLVIWVLKVMAPEIGDLLSDIIIKILSLANTSLDAATQIPQ